MSTIVIAHRTCPLDAAENSLGGVRKAGELGADGVEIDLRMTLDQRPMLMHDWTLRRTTGWPLPLELTPASVARERRLQRTDEVVPRLNEAIEALPVGLLLAVDVKTPWAMLPLIEAIKRRGIEDRVLVWCTSALAVRYAARRAPSVEVAYLKDVAGREANQRFIAKAKLLGAKAVSAHWAAVDAELVAAAHALGLRVYSYHASTPLTVEKLRAGLDGLITDYPVEAREALESLA